MDSLVITLSLAGLALFIFILRAARRFAGWLLAFAGLGVVGLVAYALGAQANATRQVAQVAQVQAMTSAATTIILFLVVLILLLVLVIIGAVAVMQWWQKRQKQQRLAEIVEALQMQALLNGSLPAVQSGIHLPAGISGQASSTPIIVIPQVSQVPWVLPSGQVVMSLSSPEDQKAQPWEWPFSSWE